MDVLLDTEYDGIVVLEQDYSARGADQGARESLDCVQNELRLKLNS